jgi:protein-S-isoprenylcysteine O-methyltransferase Ste14
LGLSSAKPVTTIKKTVHEGGPVLIFKIAFWLNTVLQLVIRAPFGMSTRSRKKTERRVSPTENILLSLLTIATGILPLVYSVTNWLAFANYALPAWMGWMGIFIMACSLLIFWRAHYDLKANWSPSLELYEGHTLITNGIYRYIRHPMYASLLLANIAQILLIQNWIAGPISIIVFILFYTFRSRAEEKMMIESFGDQYREYKKATGAILPKL